MSFLTRYALTWDVPEPSQEQVTARLAALMDEPEDDVRRILNEHEPAKWYDSEEHLIILSREWPGTLFSLDCEGEDGERYITFFRNGKSQTKEYLAPVFNEAEFQFETQPGQAETPLTAAPTWKQVYPDAGLERVLAEAPLCHIADTGRHGVYFDRRVDELVAYDSETQRFFAKPFHQILADAGLV